MMGISASFLRHFADAIVPSSVVVGGNPFVSRNDVRQEDAA